MNQTRETRLPLLTTLTGATLLGVAGLHAHWGRGGVWPGHDPASLGRKVFPNPPRHLPSPAACFAVAGALTFTTAALVTAHRPGPWQPLSQRICQLAAGTLLARGGLGFTLPALTQANPEFRRLNRTIYSPLCLVLGSALLASGEPRRGASPR